MQGELTAREHELIGLVGRGMSNKEVAHHAGMTEASVKVALCKARKKRPEMATRYAAVRVAARDHERIQAIKLDGWLKKHGYLLSTEALAEIQDILATTVADL